MIRIPNLIALMAILLILTACGIPESLRVPEAQPDMIIADVRLLDVDRGVLSAPRDVHVVSGRIAQIVDAGMLDLPGAAVRIDGQGRVLMPGLVDMHVHVLDEADLAANLTFGVTTVRNLGGLPFHRGLAARIEAGDILGPRLLTTGPIINETGGANVDILQHTLSGAEAAQAEVRRQHAQGFRHIKVYSNLTAESFSGVLAEARRLGMSVSGHPIEGRRDAPVDIDVTLQAGMATIEHVESIVWHALNDEMDLDGARMLAQRFGEAGATVSPTLVVHENLARIVETEGAHIDRPDMAMFSPVVSDFQAETYAFWADYPHTHRSDLQAFYVAFTGLLHEAGVRLVVGSDAGVMATPHGVSPWRELDLLVEAGLTPAEALRAGTINGAEVLGLADRIGRIEPGYAADFVLVEGNPLEAVNQSRSIVGVMRARVWLDRTALDQLEQAATRHGVWRTRFRLLDHVVR